MCHYSCLTCSDISLTSCLTCKGTNILNQGICYCLNAWNTDCSSQLMFQEVFQAANSFLYLAFSLIVVLYCLKIKLPLIYRLVSGIQGMSLLLYSKNIYFDYEDFFVLKSFNFLSGPYQLSWRLQGLSTSHAIQTYILLFVFIVLLIGLYYPLNIFHKPKQSFYSHIKQNSLQFMQNFYYFGGKMMLFFMGSYISSPSSQLTLIIHLIIFSVLIIITFIRLIYQYHHNNLSEQIYQSSFYLYAMLSNVAYLGLPMVGSSSMLIIVYCVPIGLLGLIVILNKQLKILHQDTIKFIALELLMTALSIAIILLDHTFQSYILLLTLLITITLIIYQMTSLYYGGISFVEPEKQIKSNKVHPVLSQSNKNIQNQQNQIDFSLLKPSANSNEEQSKKRKKYF